jgi:hypothetical protein
MKHKFVLAAWPALQVLSPPKRPVSRRLHITPWQTHSWTKKIIKLGSARRAERKLKPGAPRSNSLYLHVSFNHGSVFLCRKFRLAQTRFGRVVLHVVCCLRKPKHVSWHWQGIVREFASAK